MKLNFFFFFFRIEMRNPMLKRANAPQLQSSWPGEKTLTSVNRTNGFLLFLLALNDSWYVLPLKQGRVSGWNNFSQNDINPISRSVNVLLKKKLVLVTC